MMSWAEIERWDRDRAAELDAAMGRCNNLGQWADPRRSWNYEKRLAFWWALSKVARRTARDAMGAVRERIAERAALRVQM